MLALFSFPLSRISSCNISSIVVLYCHKVANLPDLGNVVFGDLNINKNIFGYKYNRPEKLDNASILSVNLLKLDGYTDVVIYR